MLQLVNIAKRFGAKSVLNGISFSLDPGEIVALIGANGSGKSTLVNVIARLLKPDSGCILINERDCSDEIYYKKVGFVLESPTYIEKLSAREFLELAAVLYKVPRNLSTRKVNELFAMGEWPESEEIGKFSKGMKAKLSLVVSLIKDPEYLVLDEPLDGVDFKSREFFVKKIKSLAQSGTSVLVSTHSFELIAEFAQRILVLKNGLITGDFKAESIEELSARFSSKESFLKSLI